jgi:hypothetical protein
MLSPKRFLTRVYSFLYVSRESVKNINNAAPAKDARVMELDGDKFHYPPPPNGIPFVNVEDLLKKHKSLLDRVQFSTSDNQKHFEQWYMPVVMAYARFVHLLPASENSHHSLPGGMLAHGLEVGLAAMLKADRAIMGMHKTPEKRIVYEKKWKLAVFIAAISHDIGKPLSDVLVHDNNGNQWSPYLSSLIDWGETFHSEYYVISWNSNRHKQHESLTTTALNMIMSTDIKNYLYDGSPEILSLLMDSIYGVDNQMRRIVVDADHESSTLDVKRNPARTSDMRYGIPVSVHIKDAITKLLATLKDDQINNVSSIVYFLRDGVYLRWPDALSEIQNNLPEKHMVGIPSSAPQFADLLIDTGLAKSGEGLFSSRLRTWRITEASGEVRDGWFLKLASIDVFVDSFAFEPIDGGTWVPSTSDKPNAPKAIVLENNEEDKSEASEPMPLSGGGDRISKQAFDKWGNIGEILYNMVKDYLGGKIKSGLGEPIVLEEKDLPLLWSYVQSQGTPAKSIIDEARALKIIKQSEGTKPLHSIDGNQYLVLNEVVRSELKVILSNAAVAESSQSNFSPALMNLDLFKLTDEAIKEGDKTVPEFIDDESGRLLDLDAWVNWLHVKTGNSLINIKRSVNRNVHIDYFVVMQGQKKYLRID